MLFATIGQPQVFLWMLAAGVLIGAWYACMAAVRRLLCAGPLLSLVADLAFGIGAAAIFCLALCLANYGRMRLFACLAAAMGCALFIGGVLLPVKSVVCRASRAIRHIFATILQNSWIKVIFK